MTELRKRMIECMQLRGLSERTQEAYVRAVRQLSEHYHKSPDLITEEELRQYFLFLKNVKHYARPTMTIAICGIRFCYEQTLNRQWSIFGIVRPAREKKLPVILSVAEGRQILPGRRHRNRIAIQPDDPAVRPAGLKNGPAVPARPDRPVKIDPSGPRLQPRQHLFEHDRPMHDHNPERTPSSSAPKENAASDWKIRTISSSRMRHRRRAL